MKQFKSPTPHTAHHFLVLDCVCPSCLHCVRLVPQHLSVSTHTHSLNDTTRAWHQQVWRRGDAVAFQHQHGIHRVHRRAWHVCRILHQLCHVCTASSAVADAGDSAALRHCDQGVDKLFSRVVSCQRVLGSDEIHLSSKSCFLPSDRGQRHENPCLRRQHRDSTLSRCCTGKPQHLAGDGCGSRGRRTLRSR